MEIPPERENLIKAYLAELLKWNRGMNLIGRSTENDIWENHIRDSLALYPYLLRLNIRDVIDIGSGGGIPAVPLCMLLPDRKFYLTEVDSKKLAFLEFVAKKFSLNAEVIDINSGFCFDAESAITSRAFSSIKNIFEWAVRHAPGCSVFYLLKGKSGTVEDELTQAGITLYDLVNLDKGTLLIVDRRPVIKERI